jgi:hypothetical protein
MHDNYLSELLSIWVGNMRERICDPNKDQQQLPVQNISNLDR